MAAIDPNAIAQARAAGYSDDEIAGYLEKSNPGVKQAREAGYSNKEIMSHLAGGKEAPAPAAPSDEPSGVVAGLSHGAQEAENAVKETAKNYLGVGSGREAEDPNYVPAQGRGHA
jgi:hypothetical protein